MGAAQPQPQPCCCLEFDGEAVEHTELLGAGATGASVDECAAVLSPGEAPGEAPGQVTLGDGPVLAGQVSAVKPPDGCGNGSGGDGTAAPDGPFPTDLTALDVGGLFDAAQLTRGRAAALSAERRRQSNLRSIDPMMLPGGKRCGTAAEAELQEIRRKLAREDETHSVPASERRIWSECSGSAPPSARSAGSCISI